MTSRFSRRECLVSAGLLALTASPLRSWAEDGEGEQIASRTVIGKPVACRAIPLGQAGFDEW